MSSRPRMIHPSGRTLVKIALLVASAVALGGCGASKEGPEARTVAVAKAARMKLQNSMTLQAEFEPYQDVLIHAKVSGYVNPIKVDIGDRVASGDLLATLEVPELADQLAGAQASEKRAQVEHEIAHVNYVRLVDVNKSRPNLIAQQDLDDAESKDGATAAAYATAKAEASRMVSLEDYTKVTAPFPGVITKRFVDNGSLVEAGTSSGAGAIVELAENDLLRLRFPVPESETPLIHEGGKVQVVVGTAGKAFTGTIARDAWGIDRSTRTMVVEVDVPNKDDVYKAGMYASVTLSLQEADRVIAVPLQALSTGDQPTVLVIDADGKIAERRVTVGIRTASMAEIDSGVADGDLVVIGDRAGLDVGRVVTPKVVETATAE